MHANIGNGLTPGEEFPHSPTNVRRTQSERLAGHPPRTPSVRSARSCTNPTTPGTLPKLCPRHLSPTREAQQWRHAPSPRNAPEKELTRTRNSGNEKRGSFKERQLRAAQLHGQKQRNSDPSESPTFSASRALRGGMGIGLQSRQRGRQRPSQTSPNSHTSSYNANNTMLSSHDNGSFGVVGTGPSSPSVGLVEFLSSPSSPPPPPSGKLGMSFKDRQRMDFPTASHARRVSPLSSSEPQAQCKPSPGNAAPTFASIGMGSGLGRDEGGWNAPNISRGATNSLSPRCPPEGAGNGRSPRREHFSTGSKQQQQQQQHQQQDVKQRGRGGRVEHLPPGASVAPAPDAVELSFSNTWPPSTTSTSSRDSSPPSESASSPNAQRRPHPSARAHCSAAVYPSTRHQLPPLRQSHSAYPQPARPFTPPTPSASARAPPSGVPSPPQLLKVTSSLQGWSVASARSTESNSGDGPLHRTPTQPPLHPNAASEPHVPGAPHAATHGFPAPVVESCEESDVNSTRFDSGVTMPPQPPHSPGTNTPSTGTATPRQPSHQPHRSGRGHEAEPEMEPYTARDHGFDANEMSRSPTLMHTATWSSALLGGDRREKILRRQPSAQASIAPISPRTISDLNSFSVVDGFMQRLHGPEGTPFISSNLPPVQVLGSSSARVNAAELSSAAVLAATRENGRKSSFSSLYFSMTKQHRAQRTVPMTSLPSQQLLDDDTTREVHGGDSACDESAMNESDDSFLGMPSTIGLQETEEHVFLPHYELLQDGQTPMELMLSSIRIAKEEWCNTNTGFEPSEWNLRRRPTTPMKGDGTGQDPLVTPGKGEEKRTSLETQSKEVPADGFTFGSVSPAYTTDPEDEDASVDCKVAARLLFNAENSVLLINARDEVVKYIGTFTSSAAAAALSGNEDDADRCSCDFAFITKDMRGVDYSRYNPHELYHHCIYCNRRPAAFLCMHCLKATCPSHVTRHYKENSEDCTLFLNQHDITTSYDRVFWCEKCHSFTWRHTEVYDPLVDQFAHARGTYLPEAVRDISCVGYSVQLKRPQRFSPISVHASPMRENLTFSLTASPTGGGPLVLSTAVSLCHAPMENKSFTAAPLLLQRDAAQLQGPDALRVGEAVPRLTALGAKVQGWRSTQEDAEVAFVVDFPAISIAHDGPLDAPKSESETETMAMAVFCVFDGHGGDAVAKLAASQFESHLRKAVAAARRENDMRARALLFQLDMESSSPMFSVGEASPLASRMAREREAEAEESVLAPTDMTFTTEALRRHVASLTAYPETSKCGPNKLLHPLQPQELLQPHSLLPPQARGREGSANLSDASVAAHVPMRGGGSASPVVSREEMEILRAYFASLMEEALLSLDGALRQSPEGIRGDYQCVGCTACVVGITTNFILCANLGDSGAAFYTPHRIQRISATHRVSDATEEQRIRAAGYGINNQRIEGLLAVPRALGDYDFKQCGGKGPKEQAVCVVPDVTIMPVPSLLETERWGVLVACDGVWDSATLHQIHHALVNTPNDLDVAGSATEAVLKASEMDLPRGDRDGGEANTPTGKEGMGRTLPNGETAEAVSVDALLLTSAAGVLAQCIAPYDNEEGIGMDNCSVFLIERR